MHASEATTKPPTPKILVARYPFTIHTFDPKRAATRQSKLHIFSGLKPIHSLDILCLQCQKRRPLLSPVLGTVEGIFANSCPRMIAMMLSFSPDRYIYISPPESFSKKHTSLTNIHTHDRNASHSTTPRSILRSLITVKSLCCRFSMQPDPAR